MHVSEAQTKLQYKLNAKKVLVLGAWGMCVGQEEINKTINGD